MSLASVRAFAFLPAALLLAPVFAQQPDKPASATKPGSGTTSRPSTSPPVWTPPPPSQPPGVPQQNPEPVYVSGRVMSDDGQAFSDLVAIESVCDGVSHTEGVADRNGRFSFRLGDQNSGVAQDASVGTQDGYFSRPNIVDNPVNPDDPDDPANAADAQDSADPADSGREPPAYITPKHLVIANCELRAKLSGYRSDSISLDSRRALDSPDVGAIMLHRIGPMPGLVVSATTLAAPRIASSAFEKGQTALRKNKPDDARKNFEKAVQAYPGYAAAWCALGQLQTDQSQFDDALRSFQAAIRADPKYVAPYVTLSAIQSIQKQWAPLAETTNTLLRLDPYDYPQAYYLNGLANYYLRNPDAAEKSLREAERLDSQGRLPRTWQLMGIILADRRAYTEAAEQMSMYLKLAPQAADAGAVRAQVARLEALGVGMATQAQQR